MEQNNYQRIIEWDKSLITKYNYSGPRYTSYPTALEFNTQFSSNDFEKSVNCYPEKNLSLYIHIPFCHKLCYFCGCNKIVTRQKHKVDKYLDDLELEIINHSQFFKNRHVTQLHLGGGTPTFLSDSEITRLLIILKAHFNIAPHAELSIEIDPREISLSKIDHLANEGFNRLSIGIQDFDKRVQQLINREQNEQFIVDLVNKAKKRQFKSINLDLIYGLPTQTVDSFLYTLKKIITLSPDRLSIFNYAHLPSHFAAQRKIKETDLPTAETKMDILQQTINTLIDANYRFIGMDHFAKSTDELSIAQEKGQLHRNFQGYTTQGENDLLGLGVSAISMLGNSYAQNQKDLFLYAENIKIHQHALWKGFTMNQDDRIRRDVIKQLICHFQLIKSEIAHQHNINFDDYFSEDLALLKPLEKDGLIIINKDTLKVTSKGRLLIRNICMCFDIYLRQTTKQQQFSRVI